MMAYPLNDNSSAGFLPLFTHDAVAKPLTNVTATASQFGITMEEMDVLEGVELSMSLISILAALFVMISFLTYPSLNQKSVNRLIFYASIGNIITNAGTLISVSGLKAGVRSGLCQAQGFLIQWIMPADSLWTFCLAINVFLTFHSLRWDIKLRNLEPIYCVLCYGIPLVPALTYLVMDVGYGMDIYGDATMWCWVTEKHHVLRLATFYGPVWLIIAATFTLYALVGRNIYKNRISNIYVQQQLDNNCSDTTFSTVGKLELWSRLSSIIRAHESNVENRPVSPIRELDLSSAPTHPQSACEPSFAAGRLPSTSHAPKDVVFLSGEDSIATPAPPKDTKYVSTLSRAPTQSNTSPRTSRGAQYTASIRGPIISPLAPLNASARRGAQTYARVAILFFIIMVIYWVPPTINRVYSFNHPPKFGLNLAAAAVLPLQGFFNCVIYCFTSRSQLKEIWRSAKARWWHKPPVMRRSVGSTALNAEGRTIRRSQLDVVDELALKYGLDEESSVGDDSPGDVSPLQEIP